MTRTKNVRNATKFKRSIKAISPVIATLLMIAIAVVASLVVYAWVTGYIGGTTSTAGKAIQIQSVYRDSAGLLTVYVQNVGQGAVEFKAGESLYVNDNLVPIISTLTPLAAGQTATLATNTFVPANTKVDIKVTTTDGTFMTRTGTIPSSSSTSSSPTPTPIQYAVNFVLGANGATISPTAGSHNVGGATLISATANPGYHFASWTSTGSITFADATLASTTATVNGAGSITANFAIDVVTYAVNFVLGANGATISPTAGSHNVGGATLISATANPGYHFASWTSTGSITFADATLASTTATVNGAGSITANFAADTQTLILRPNSNGDSQLSRNTGSNNYQCVDEDPSDDATTFVYDASSSDGSQRDYYGLPDHGSATGTIDSVTVYINCRQVLSGGSTSQSTANTVLRYNGNSNYGVDINLGTSWALSQTTYTTRPGGAVAWTWADIDSLQAGVRLDTADSVGSTQSIGQCTQVWVVVTYSP